MSAPELIRTLVRVAFFLVVFCLGTGVRRGDLKYLRARPRLLLRSAAAIYVVTPIFAVGMVSLVPVSRPVGVALLLLSIAPGAPFTPRPVLKAGGDRAYAYSLLVSVALLAVLFIPLAVAGLSGLFPANARIAPRTVAATVTVTHLLPLVAGLLLARLAPKAAAKIARIVSPVAFAVLIVAVVAVLLSSVPSLRTIRATDWIAIAVMVVFALLVGHLLGGPSNETRAVLAINNATRFPGTATVIAAAALPELRLLPILLSYVLAAALLGGLYSKLIHPERHGPAERKPVHRRPALRRHPLPP